MFHKAADVIGIDMKDIRIYEDSNSGIRNAYDAGCEQIVVICDKENEEEFLKRPGVIEVMQDFSLQKNCNTNLKLIFREFRRRNSLFVIR